jgi:hypothetical protein
LANEIALGWNNRVTSLGDKTVPAGKWEARQLQAVVFLRKAVTATDIFSQLVGETPESQQERPKEAIRVQSGPLLRGLLQITISPIRVDIVLSPALGADAPFGSTQTLGEFSAEVKNFVSVIRKWLPGCGLSALRLALVAQAFAPADSLTSAYEILKDNLTSVAVQPGKMRDLWFRVNWPIPSDLTEEKYLNRLTTWASVTVSTRGGSPGGPLMTMIERYYAYREIDVNSPAEHSDELPADRMVSILDEIYRVILATAETGERP